ncbi:MAG: hypothetical protein VYE04_04690 [Pseudomonadota bacterium]|nr:hypothetical protein [Pseudomonadota bacterium]
MSATLSIFLPVSVSSKTVGTMAQRLASRFGVPASALGSKLMGHT